MNVKRHVQFSVFALDYGAPETSKPRLSPADRLLQSSLPTINTRVSSSNSSRHITTSSTILAYLRTRSAFAVTLLEGISSLGSCCTSPARIQPSTFQNLWGQLLAALESVPTLSEVKVSEC